MSSTYISQFFDLAQVRLFHVSQFLSNPHLNYRLTLEHIMDKIDAYFNKADEENILLAYYFGRQKLLNCLALERFVNDFLHVFVKALPRTQKKITPHRDGCCLCKEKADIFKDFWKRYQERVNVEDKHTDKDVDEAWKDIVQMWMDVETKQNNNRTQSTDISDFEDACQGILEKHKVYIYAKSNPNYNNNGNKNAKKWSSLIGTVKRKLKDCHTILWKLCAPDYEATPQIKLHGKKIELMTVCMTLKIKSDTSIDLSLIQKFRSTGVTVQLHSSPKSIDVKCTMCTKCLGWKSTDDFSSILSVLSKFHTGLGTKRKPLKTHKRIVTGQNSLQMPNTPLPFVQIYKQDLSPEKFYRPINYTKLELYNKKSSIVLSSNLDSKRLFTINTNKNQNFNAKVKSATLGNKVTGAGGDQTEALSSDLNERKNPIPTKKSLNSSKSRATSKMMILGGIQNSINPTNNLNENLQTGDNISIKKSVRLQCHDHSDVDGNNVNNSSDGRLGNKRMKLDELVSMRPQNNKIEVHISSAVPGVFASDSFTAVYCITDTNLTPTLTTPVTVPQPVIKQIPITRKLQNTNCSSEQLLSLKATAGIQSIIGRKNSGIFHFVPEDSLVNNCLPASSSNDKTSKVASISISKSQPGKELLNSDSGLIEKEDFVQLNEMLRKRLAELSKQEGLCGLSKLSSSTTAMNEIKLNENLQTGDNISIKKSVRLQCQHHSDVDGNNVSNPGDGHLGNKRMKLDELDSTQSQLNKMEAHIPSSAVSESFGKDFFTAVNSTTNDNLTSKLTTPVNVPVLKQIPTTRKLQNTNCSSEQPLSFKATADNQSIIGRNDILYFAPEHLLNNDSRFTGIEEVTQLNELLQRRLAKLCGSSIPSGSTTAMNEKKKVQIEARKMKDKDPRTPEDFSQNGELLQLNGIPEKQLTELNGLCIFSVPSSLTTTKKNHSINNEKQTVVHNEIKKTNPRRRVKKRKCSRHKNAEPVAKKNTILWEKSIATVVAEHISNLMPKPDGQLQDLVKYEKNSSNTIYQSNFLLTRNTINQDELKSYTQKKCQCSRIHEKEASANRMRMKLKPEQMATWIPSRLSVRTKELLLRELEQRNRAFSDRGQCSLVELIMNTDESNKVEESVPCEEIITTNEEDSNAVVQVFTCQKSVIPLEITTDAENINTVDQVVSFERSLSLLNKVGVMRDNEKVINVVDTTMEEEDSNMCNQFIGCQNSNPLEVRTNADHNKISSDAVCVNSNSPLLETPSNSVNSNQLAQVATQSHVKIATVDTNKEEQLLTSLRLKSKYRKNNNGIWSRVEQDTGYPKKKIENDSSAPTQEMKTSQYHDLKNLSKQFKRRNTLVGFTLIDTLESDSRITYAAENASKNFMFHSFQYQSQPYVNPNSTVVSTNPSCYSDFPRVYGKIIEKHKSKTNPTDVLKNFHDDDDECLASPKKLIENDAIFSYLEYQSSQASNITKEPQPVSRSPTNKKAVTKDHQNPGELLGNDLLERGPIGKIIAHNLPVSAKLTKKRNHTTKNKCVRVEFAGPEKHCGVDSLMEFTQKISLAKAILAVSSLHTYGEMEMSIAPNRSTEPEQYTSKPTVGHCTTFPSIVESKPKLNGSEEITSTSISSLMDLLQNDFKMEAIIHDATSNTHDSDTAYDLLPELRKLDDIIVKIENIHKDMVPVFQVEKSKDNIFETRGKHLATTTNNHDFSQSNWIDQELSPATTKLPEGIKPECSLANRENLNANLADCRNRVTTAPANSASETGIGVNISTYRPTILDIYNNLKDRMRKPLPKIPCANKRIAYAAIRKELHKQTFTKDKLSRLLATNCGIEQVKTLFFVAKVKHLENDVRSKIGTNKSNKATTTRVECKKRKKITRNPREEPNTALCETLVGAVSSCVTETTDGLKNKTCNHKPSKINPVEVSSLVTGAVKPLQGSHISIKLENTDFKPDTVKRKATTTEVVIKRKKRRNEVEFLLEEMHNKSKLEIEKKNPIKFDNKQHVPVGKRTGGKETKNSKSNSKVASNFFSSLKRAYVPLIRCQVVSNATIKLDQQN